MNLPRITLTRFLRSRFFPWALVAVLVTAMSGGGWYGNQVYEEREEYRRQVEQVRKEYVRATKEKLELQEQVRELRDTKTDTKKVVEEIRPDGTRITIKEETKEEVASTIDSSSEVSKGRFVEESGVEESITETEESSKTTIVESDARYRIGAGVVVRGLDETPDLSVSGSVKVLGPFHGRVTIEIDGATYQFEGASIGVEIEL
jgi:cell division protein FtsB